MCDIWNDEVRQCLLTDPIEYRLRPNSYDWNNYEEFKYLGRSYSFNMSNTAPKQLLERKLSDLLVITNHLNIKAQTKLKILSQYIHSQVLFEIKL